MPSEADTALRPWLLGLGTLALAGSGLLAGILHLPSPWPGVLGTLLATGLLLMLGIMAAGAWVGTPFRLATLAEGWLLRWTARFAADPGAFLYRWAEAAPDIDRARERLQGAADRGHLFRPRPIRQPPAHQNRGRDEADDYDERPGGVAQELQHVRPIQRFTRR